jgi:hypothetical protein
MKISLLIHFQQLVDLISESVMSHTKHTILTVLMLLISVSAAIAQSFVTEPYEGTVHEYICDGISVGADYSFYVSSNVEGNALLDDALTTEFDFIGDASGLVDSNGLATATIQWNAGSSLNQYQVWLEVSSGGCSNRIRIEVSPLPNNRSIGFDALASNECFLPDGNGFELPVSFLGNEGEPLTQNQFPVNVEYTVNGTAYQQNMQSADENLQIGNTMVEADPAQDTQVVVEITGATDAHNAELFPGEENSTHTRIIFAIPVIEFTQQMKLQKELNEESTAYIIHSPVGFDWQGPGTDYTWGE